MMEGTNTYSLSDIRTAVEGNNDGLFGTGNGFWILVLFLFMFGFGGNGFGFGGANANGALTRAEMYEGFNNNQVMNKLNGLENGLCDGFYNVNTTMLQGFNGVGRDLCNIGYKIDSCCCQTQNGIESLKYEMAQNTCAVTNAVHAEGEATRALLRDQEVQKLRDELQTAQLTIGNTAQSQYILSQIGRFGIYSPTFQCGCNYGC